MALLHVARFHIDELTEQLHAIFVGVVEIQPERAAISSSGVMYFGPRQRSCPRRRDQSCLHSCLLRQAQDTPSSLSLPKGRSYYLTALNDRPPDPLVLGGEAGNQHAKKWSS